MLKWVLESIKKHSISGLYWIRGPRRKIGTSAKPGRGSLRFIPLCPLPSPTPPLHDAPIPRPQLPFCLIPRPQLPFCLVSLLKFLPRVALLFCCSRTPNHLPGFTLHPQQPSTQASLTASQIPGAGSPRNPITHMHLCLGCLYFLETCLSPRMEAFSFLYVGCLAQSWCWMNSCLPPKTSLPSSCRILPISVSLLFIFTSQWNAWGVLGFT